MGLQLVENLADAIDNGSRDQHSDALVCCVFFFFFSILRLDLGFLLKIIELLFCWAFGKVNELNNHFEKCQQLLNSIAASVSSKSMVNYLLFLLWLF